MSTDQLLEIERQGAEFVHALTPFSEYAGQPFVLAVWESVASWRGYSTAIPRRSSNEWRTLVVGAEELGEACDYAFFAGAEQAIRDYEAAQ